jgi:hypothetical protein
MPGWSASSHSVASDRDCDLAGVDQLSELTGYLPVEPTRFDGLDRHPRPDSIATQIIELRSIGNLV